MAEGPSRGIARSKRSQGDQRKLDCVPDGCPPRARGSGPLHREGSMESEIRKLRAALARRQSGRGRRSFGGGSRMWVAGYARKEGAGRGSEGARVADGDGAAAQRSRCARMRGRRSRGELDYETAKLGVIRRSAL